MQISVYLHVTRVFNFAQVKFLSEQKNLRNEDFIRPEVEELFLNPFEKWVFYGSNLVSLQFGISKKVAVSKLF